MWAGSSGCVQRNNALLRYSCDFARLCEELLCLAAGAEPSGLNLCFLDQTVLRKKKNLKPLVTNNPPFCA